MTYDTVAKSAAFVRMEVMYGLVGWTNPPPPLSPQPTFDFTKTLPLTLHHQRTHIQRTMAKKSRVVLRDSGRFTVVSDPTMDCDDTAAKSDGDLGERSDKPITAWPEESVVVDHSLDFGEDLPKGKNSLLVMNVT